MSGETRESLPEELGEWLDERAAERGTDRGDVLSQAVAAYRVLERQSDTIERGTLDDGGGDTTAEQLTELLDRIAALESKLDSRVDDVRERVVQVKRESDAKAPADHDHPELDAVASRLEALDDVEADVERVSGRVEAGFDNFEEVLTHLRDATDELDGRVETLARVVLSLRSRVETLEAATSRREAAADLQRRANRLGVTKATCEGCGDTVHLGLLGSPTCPHCEATFEDVEPARHFFGSATLARGGHPALEGESDSVETPTDLFEGSAGE
jgi:predicted Zn-ribbon and HTH transcriptional regulator